VRSLAPVDRPSLAGTRWRSAKSALLRVLRLVTAPQAAFNHATVDALDEVRAELAACRGELAAARDELATLHAALEVGADGRPVRVQRLEHAALQVHGPLLVELIDRAGGLLDAGTPVPADRGIEAATSG
jgi:hypothetical protein